MDRFDDDHGMAGVEDQPYDPKAFELGGRARMEGQLLQDCPQEGWTKQSWVAGWVDCDASINEDTITNNKLMAQVVRLRSVIDAIGPYAYETRQVPPGPEGPRVVFICQVCGAKSRSWEPGICHYGGCILGEHSLPAADTYLDVPECPRCGQDHCQISFFEFETLNLWTHWGMCPEIHEPIVCQATPDSSYYVKEPTEGYYYA